MEKKKVICSVLLLETFGVLDPAFSNRLMRARECPKCSVVCVALFSSDSFGDERGEISG